MGDENGIMDKLWLTPRQRVMTVLRGEIPDMIPFTVYETKIPRCFEERELRNRGMCLVRRTTSYKISYPNVKIKSYQCQDQEGKDLVRTVYSTPSGDMTALRQLHKNTTWELEYMFKGKDDYKALQFMLNDAVVEENHKIIAKEDKELGDDFIVRDNLPLEPLQNLISIYMGTNTFCYEWMDNRDELLKLYNALVELARKIYPVVADGPLEFANYGGNVMPSVIGVENFRKYYMPHYNEAAEVLHKRGKLIGCHLDGNNALIMENIAQTDLDYIEAYDAGMSPPLKEALKIWHDKVIWLNYPSAWHLKPLNEVYTGAIELLREAQPYGRVIMGVTEDVPEDRWKKNFKAIQSAVENLVIFTK